MDDKNIFNKPYLTVSQVASLDPLPSTNERVNMVAVVHKIGNIRMIEKTNKFRLNIEMVDPIAKPFRSIILCIWERSADSTQKTQTQQTSSNWNTS